jgi:carbonic anhydrase
MCHRRITAAFPSLINADSIEESIKTDIAILRASPLIKKTTEIVGLAYDVETGILSEVGQDTKI